MLNRITNKEKDYIAAFVKMQLFLYFSKKRLVYFLKRGKILS